MWLHRNKQNKMNAKISKAGKKRAYLTKIQNLGKEIDSDFEMVKITSIDFVTEVFFIEVRAGMTRADE